MDDCELGCDREAGDDDGDDDSDDDNRFETFEHEFGGSHDRGGGGCDDHDQSDADCFGDDRDCVAGVVPTSPFEFFSDDAFPDSALILDQQPLAQPAQPAQPAPRRPQQRQRQQQQQQQQRRQSQQSQPQPQPQHRGHASDTDDKYAKFQTQQHILAQTPGVTLFAATSEGAARHVRSPYTAGHAPHRATHTPHSLRTARAAKRGCTLVIALGALLATLVIVSATVLQASVHTTRAGSAARAAVRAARTAAVELDRTGVGPAEQLAPAVCPSGTRRVRGVCTRRLYHPDPIDRTLVDNGTDPCDDFYGYACGAYTRDPANRGDDATFTHLESANERLLAEIVHRESGRGSKLGAFYDACVRHEAERGSGARAAAASRLGTSGALLAHVDALRDAAQLEPLLVELLLHDVPLPLGVSVEIDPLDPSRVLLALRPLAAPVDYDDAPTDTLVRQIYGEVDAAESLRAARTVADRVADAALACGLAESAAADADLLEYVGSGRFAARDRVSRATAAELLAPLRIDVVLDGMQAAASASGPVAEAGSAADTPVPRAEIWLHTPACATALAERVVRRTSIDEWRGALRRTVVQHVLAPSLTADARLYHTYRTAYDPTHPLPWERPRRLSVRRALPADDDARCVEMTRAFLPVLLDNYFLDLELDRTDREALAAIGERVRAQLLVAAKAAHAPALAAKLALTRIEIGAPPSWPLDRSLLAIGAHHVDNLLAVRRYHVEEQLRRAARSARGVPIDADELFDGLVSVPNAYMRRQLNTVVLNAGLLRPPMDSPRYDLVARYARIGTVLGHELVHAIDRDGLRFCASGAVATANDACAVPAAQQLLLERASLCFVALYSGETRAAGTVCNGLRSLNENIADVLGFGAAYDAVFAHNDSELDTATGADARHGTHDPVIVRQAQREFYLNYAQLWCTALAPEDEAHMAQISGHALPEFRVNRVVQTHADFRDAWNCPASTRLPAGCTVF